MERYRYERAYKKRMERPEKRRRITGSYRSPPPRRRQEETRRPSYCSPPPRRRRRRRPRRRNADEIIAQLAVSAANNVSAAAANNVSAAARQRKWYVPSKVWCLETELGSSRAAIVAVPTTPALTTRGTPRTPFVSHTAVGVEVPDDTTEDGRCGICGDILEKSFNCTHSKWVYNDTMRAPQLGGRIVHIMCDEDCDYI